NGRPITKVTRDILARFNLSPDFTNMDYSNFMAMQAVASKSSRVKQALQYYGSELNWFNLYDVYETIVNDYEELTGSRQLPTHWVEDTQGRNRLKDFTESANNAYISG